MAELDDKLNEAQLLHNEMRHVAERGGNEAAREVIRLRARFTALLVEILVVMKSDPRLLADEDKRQEFSTLFGNMRQNLNAYQSRWRSSAIDADKEGYRKASEAMIRSQDEFYADARALLGKA